MRLWGCNPFTRLASLWLGQRLGQRLVRTAMIAMGLVVAVSSTAMAVTPYEMSAKDRKTIEKIEDYLNNIRTMTARFAQISDDGDYSEGKLYLQRPGKLRFEYKPPVPILIVARNGDLVYYDRELDQVSFVDLKDTPLWFVAQEQVDFDKGVIVTDMKYKAGMIEVTIVETDDPDKGHVVLRFTDAPFELTKWTVVDAQRNAVNVALFSTQTDVEIDPELFIFRNTQRPKFNKDN